MEQRRTIELVMSQCEGVTMIDPLREMFNYHYWATRALLDHLAQMPEEILDETVPGTAGSIRETLSHLARADLLYTSLMNGEGRPPREPQNGTVSLDGLRGRFESVFARWESILDNLDHHDPSLPAEDGEPETPHVKNLLLTQAIHHGTDHRTHICTILGAHGHSVPDMDEWAYWFSPEHKGG